MDTKPDRVAKCNARAVTLVGTGRDYMPPPESEDVLIIEWSTNPQGRFTTGIVLNKQMALDLAAKIKEEAESMAD